MIVPTLVLFRSALALVLVVETFGMTLTEGQFTALGMLAIAVLICLSGFSSSSETAMFSLPPHRMEALVEEGRRGANTPKDHK